MKFLFYSVLFCLSATSMSGQVEGNMYSAYAIPKALLENADVVIRKYSHNFEVIDNASATEVEHKIVTILNEQGKNHASPTFQYDKFNVIDDIEAAIYDANGKLLKRMKKKDISDFKLFEMYVDDARYKTINFPHTNYPYTIEYIVTTKHKGLRGYVYWHPINGFKQAVENANLSITMLNTKKLRYKELGVPNKADIQNNTYSWSIENMKAKLGEPYMTYDMEQFPAVITAPSDFEVSGLTGDMSTWKSFGDFLYKLGEGRQVLDDTKKQFLKELTADCNDIPCKVEKIYTHLQNTTRYFSIQLGIGGWQPISATDVDKRKYSDCKGLSNYMVAMLDAVGVKAHNVVIRAGDEPFNKVQYFDFANPYFNHMIACVPMEKDTMWLECTSQTESCGFLSDFTSDRPALVLTPEGGKLVKTPKYDEKSNISLRTAKVDLGIEGGAEVDLNIVFSGINQKHASYLAEINGEERKKKVYEYLQIDNATISDLAFTRNKTRIPTVEQNVKLRIEPLASKSGKRLFLPLNIFTKWTRMPSPDSTRRFDVQADDSGFTQQDNVTFKFPEGFKLESKPTPLSITSVFGSFEMKFTEKAPNEWVYYRKLVLNSSIQPKEKYNDLVEFFKNISKADKSKLILVKVE